MSRRTKINSDDSEMQKVKISRESWSQAIGLVKYVQPYKYIFFGGLAAIALSSITTLSFPFFLKKLIDSAQLVSTTNFGRWDDPTNIALVMIGVLFVQMIVSFLRVYLFTQVGERALADLRYDLYGHMIRLPMQFFSERRVGELSSRISSDLSQIQDAVTFILADLIRGVLTLVIGIGLILFISVKLTLIMLSVIPIVVVTAVIFGRYIRKLSRKAQDNLADSNTIVQETLSGISSVKAFTNEVFETNRYRKSLDKVVALSVANGKTRGLFWSHRIGGLVWGWFATGRGTHIW